MRTLEDARCIVSVSYRQTHVAYTCEVNYIQGRTETRERTAQANLAPLNTDIV